MPTCSDVTYCIVAMATTRHAEQPCRRITASYWLAICQVSHVWAFSVRILLFFNLSKFRNISLVGDDAPSKLVQKYWNISHKWCLSDRPKLKNSIFVTNLSPIAQTLSHKPGCNWIYRMRRFNSYHSLLKMGLYVYIWYTQIDIARDPHFFTHI